MSAATRLAGFAVLLAGIFGLAALAGGAVSPPKHGTPCSQEASMNTMAMTPQGLAVAENGYRLVAETTILPAGRSQELRFRIVDSSGRAVTSYCEEHGARLHLILVRRDLTGYQHVHPHLGADGTWSIGLKLDQPGSYRVFTDFNSGGHMAVLGTDLNVAGDYRPEPLAPVTNSAQVDGYSVRLDAETPRAGHESHLHFKVLRGGREVTEIQPYLGARGHLVALREGDLAYLHVHPEEGETPGAGITFHADFPSGGRYRLFLQFKHAGAVRTAEFTQVVAR